MMWPLIVRNVLLPTHEALLRRPTLSLYRDLLAHVDQSSDVIERYQLARLKSLLRHAKENVSYWHDRFQRAANLRHLPTCGPRWTASR